ncbi:hypothetical protein J828_3574 [Acinetobacter baumannii 25691_5]|nr:hypothetical protein J828_3574 [Acinetobacter baumannii 25691_5]
MLHHKILKLLLNRLLKLVPFISPENLGNKKAPELGAQSSFKI